MDSNCCSEPVSYAAVEEDCTSGLVIEFFDDSNNVGADVLLHGYPQSCMPNLVEGLLEVYEDMVEVLLVLEIFLTEDSLRIRLKICSVMLLPSLKPACSSAMIFSACGPSLFSMIFSMTVVLALLQVAFLGKCDD